jgi:predicted O-methyltransferase YrrM
MKPARPPSTDPPVSPTDMNDAAPDPAADQAAQAFARLKAHTERIGPVYGTEDWSVFLYALVKMQAPQTAVELGTGLGATALWVAQAMKEVGAGKLWTIDSGQDWAGILEHSPDLFTPRQRTLDFAGYMADMIAQFGLQQHLEFIGRTMPPYPVLGQKLDLLFSDFRHGPNDILEILGHFLPRMADSSSVFIDSASTSFPSYAMLELLVGQLNAGKLPAMLLRTTPVDQHEALWQQVRSSRYTLMHMVERKARVQNSTAWLKIEPVDLRPYPAAPFH